MQVQSLTANLEAAVKNEEVLVRARKSVGAELVVAKRDAEERLELLNASMTAQESLRTEVSMLTRQLASAKKELVSSEAELELCRRQLH